MGNLSKRKHHKKKMKMRSEEEEEEYDIENQVGSKCGENTRCLPFRTYGASC